MKMKKRLLALFVALTMLTGCAANEGGGTGGESQGSAGAQELRLAFAVEPATIDPQKCTLMGEATVMLHMFEGLYRLDGTKVVPAGAKSYEVSKDGLTYTFHLRDGAKWSDGKEVTADDFKFGFERLVDPATASPGAYLAGMIKNATKINKGEMDVSKLGVEAVDDKTIKFNLEYPAPYFPGMLSTAAFLPARRDLVKKYGKEYGTSPEKLAYNGPFKATKWTHGEEMVLERNENHWDAANVKLNKVSIQIVPDPSTQLGMYENGELDYVEVPTELAANYPDAKKYSTGGVDYLQVSFVNGKYYSNKNFRKAISAALDREEYVKMAFGGVSEPAKRYVLPDVLGVKGTYGEEYPLEAFPANAEPEKAKEYLAAAMKELGVSSPGTIEITLSTADTEDSRKGAEVIQEQLTKNLGIKVKVNQMASKQYWANWAKSDFEFMVGGWTPDYSDPRTYLDLYISGSGSNRGVYKNPAYDELLEKSNTNDLKTRFDALFEAEKIVCDDLPIIPLDVRKKQYLINEKLKNFQPSFVQLNYNWLHAEFTE
jgi:oligopeptide transport system substrate-binding protein